ncbi:hypothetical protein ACKVMT_04305 [Halobacteriales archaeon Cl-PHB]
MPINIVCLGCGTTLLAMETIDPLQPIDNDVCPNCGDDEFEKAE